MNASGPDASARHPGQIRRMLGLTTLVGNLVGALLTEFYFRFVSPYGDPAGFTTSDLVYFAAAFGLLMVIGYSLSSRWLRPVEEALRALPRPPSILACQRAVLLPYAMAAINVIGWIGASVLFNFVWQVWTGQFTLAGAASSMFGTLCIAAPAATASVFFTVEHRWRTVLPAFFPDGDTSLARQMVRFPVGARLLAISVMTSVVPLSLLGALSYLRVSAALTAEAAPAQQIVSTLLVLIAFIVAAGTALAIWLALFVASSVASPLRELETAMAAVSRTAILPCASRSSATTRSARSPTDSTGWSRGSRSATSSRRHSASTSRPRSATRSLPDAWRSRASSAWSRSSLPTSVTLRPGSRPASRARSCAISTHTSPRWQRRSAPTMGSCCSSSATRSKRCSARPSRAPITPRAACRPRSRCGAGSRPGMPREGAPGNPHCAMGSASTRGRSWRATSAAVSACPTPLSAIR